MSSPTTASQKAPSVHYLATTFLDEVLATKNSSGEFLDRETTIHDIEDLRNSNVPGVIQTKGISQLCPKDGNMGAACVDCIKGEDNVGGATHMLSYSWGYTIGDIIDTLK